MQFFNVEVCVQPNNQGSHGGITHAMRGRGGPAPDKDVLDGQGMRC